MEDYLDKINSIQKLSQDPENAMDVGCGPYGGMSLVYNARRWTLIDILNDVYKDMAKRNSYFVYLTCGGEALPLAGNSFDIIFSTNALDHTEDRIKCEQEIYRTLKPDGIFALVVHCRTSKQLNMGHKQILTSELLIEELALVGFFNIGHIMYQTKYKTFAGQFIK